MYKNVKINFYHFSPARKTIIKILLHINKNCWLSSVLFIETEMKWNYEGCQIRKQLGKEKNYNFHGVKG